jgi:hypothetical protein
MKKIEPKIYTQADAIKIAEGLIRVDHARLAAVEKKDGKRYFETFGEWRKANPLNPVASKNYPEDEYVMVISAHIKYFDFIADSRLDDDEDELE